MRIRPFRRRGCPTTTHRAARRHPHAEHRHAEHRHAEHRRTGRIRTARLLLAVGVLAGVTLSAAPGTPAALPVGLATDPAARQSVLLELDTEPAAPAWQRAAEGARRERRTPEQAHRAAA
ncbi:hypothetical protein, partial [Kitasatospora sp. LaBMicrA B282]|uniref:hypothetical protein n=1 Tax=Kitasatospora sp. LaBMicrA B282 TaxID=3420949 RepID=UPI003D146D1E